MAQSLSNLPIGAKIKFGKHSINGESPQAIIWILVAKNHSDYTSGSMTFLTNQIIDLRPVDASELSNTDENRRGYGNNDYDVSNIDQWLNKSGSPWFVPAHNADQSPNNSYVLRGTGYDSRPGFLTYFSSKEIDAILPTTIKFAKYSNTVGSATRKIFLPSATEVGFSLGVSEGSSWGYFKDAESRKSVLSDQCYNNSPSGDKPVALASPWYWWLRSAEYTTTYNMYVVSYSGNSYTPPVLRGEYGIRPAMNLKATQLVSDFTDGDGCYTIIENSPPDVPTVSIPSVIWGGTEFQVSVTGTDPDGDTLSYSVERSLNGGNWEVVRDPLLNSVMPDTVPYGTSTVQYRARAFDLTGSQSYSSTYGFSNLVNVRNNVPPTITGVSGDLGIKSEPFSIKYNVIDSDSDNLPVVEMLDSKIIRTYIIQNNDSTEQTFDVRNETWLSLTNGSHTIHIDASDGRGGASCSSTFIKSVSSIRFTSNPMMASTMPIRAKITVDGSIPANAVFKVEVCNNGGDTSPTWEDATSSVKSGWAHVFTNTTKKNDGAWAVRVRVSVDRNGSSGACYITSIGGNFE